MLRLVVGLYSTFVGAKRAGNLNKYNPGDIVDFWFGKIESAQKPIESSKVQSWYKRDAAFDALISEKYGQAVEAAIGGQFTSWEEEPLSQLALVILLDQFTRNIYRNTPKAFIGDERAVQVVKNGVKKGFHQRLRDIHPIYVAIYLHPLMHAENIEDQKLSVELQQDTVDYYSSKPEFAASAGFNASALKYAKLHQEVIEKYGRFPHRNAILGRPNRPEEENIPAHYKF